MKVDERYEITPVVVECLPDGNAGSIYVDFHKFKLDKPNSEYFFAFCVVDTETGYIPDNCNKWNETLDDAMNDYRLHVLMGFSDIEVNDEFPFSSTAKNDESLKYVQSPIGLLPANVDGLRRAVQHIYALIEDRDSLRKRMNERDQEVYEMRLKLARIENRSYGPMG